MSEDEVAIVDLKNERFFTQYEVVVHKPLAIKGQQHMASPDVAWRW